MRRLSLLMLIGIVCLQTARCELAHSADDAALRCAGATAALAAQTRDSAAPSPPSPEVPPKRHYAPDYDAKIQHLALEVTPDFTNRSISAKAALKLKTTFRPVRELRLDARNLNVLEVQSSQKIQAWQNTSEAIVITFEQPIQQGEEFTIDIRYTAEPRQGLYFRTPQMGYQEGDTHLFSQGETVTGSHWYPTLDTPNTLFTSEITCIVPDGMTVFSNGALKSEGAGPTPGTRSFHWVQNKPHANYLVTLVAGYFKKLEEQYNKIPLAFATPPSEFAQASNSFHGTREMMRFFEEHTGVPYPWDKYYQICVNDFVAGGMENTSATTLADSTLFTSETENIRDSEGLVAHELAHQWFGDLVTCKDWSHTWLNEGFATYYEALWQEHNHGKDEFLFDLIQQRRRILEDTGSPVPIVRRTFEQPDDMFGYTSYQKGGWVLHMLRSELGDSLFKQCVKTYLNRHAHQSVVTEDLRKVVEELSGRSFDQFFDQWVYHAHHPELQVDYTWDEQAKTARIQVRQTQKMDRDVPLFAFPLKARFKGAFGTEERTMLVTDKEHVFTYALNSAPELVRLDPDLQLLAKITFNPTRQMLARQIADEHDVVGRLLAVDSLAKRDDKEAISLLGKALQSDAFYAVRMAASSGLRRIHSDDALRELLQHTAQSDARARKQVADDIGGFYKEISRDYALKLLNTERNPAIVATALRSLGAYSAPGIRDVLLKYLNTPSYHHELANAAAAAIRAQDDPSYIEPLLKAVENDRLAWRSRDFGEVLGTLASLARNQDDRSAVREFILGQLSSPKERVRVGALNALGKLGDPKATGPIEKYTTAQQGNRERAAAQAALTSLRTVRPPKTDARDFGTEILDLQKANRELKSQLDAIQKKLAAQAERKTAPNEDGVKTKRSTRPPVKNVKRNGSATQSQSPTRGSEQLRGDRN